MKKGVFVFLFLLCGFFLYAQTYEFFAVRFIPGAQNLVFSGAENELRGIFIYDLQGNKKSFIGVLKAQNGETLSDDWGRPARPGDLQDIHPGGKKLLLSGSFGRNVREADLNGVIVNELEMPADETTSYNQFRYSASGSLIYAKGYQNNDQGSLFVIGIWSNGKFQRKIETGLSAMQGDSENLALHEGSKLIAYVPFQSKEVYFFDYESGKKVKSINVEGISPFIIRFDLSGEHLIWDGNAKSIHYVSVKTGKIVWKSEFLGNSYLSGDIRVTEKTVEVCGGNSRYLIWDHSGKLLHDVMDKTQTGFRCRIGASGNYYLTYGFDKTVVFDKDGKKILELSKKEN